MLKSLVDIIRREVSGAIAFDYVAGIARFHRIQASPGFREAAEWCGARLEEAGLETRILTYPARFSQTYWSEPMFQEWSCEEATLDLVSPAAEARRLCDFRANPLSVIQRSVSTPPDGLRGEVVAVDKADEHTSYEGVDVAGKFVLFTGEAQRAYEIAVVEKGALGLVTDQMPEFPPVRKAFELPGATTYTSFWPRAPYPRPAAGFVLSPAEGARLRRLLREQAAGSGTAGPVILHARIRADLYDGEIENVTAVLPGTDAPGAACGSAGSSGAREVLLVAHLCHPKPSANDNASGSGTLIEVARALQTLISSGRLPRPRRTIRFLLVPEMTGTYAYLATNEDSIGRIVAALNLDMVGENQGLTGGPLQVEYPPLACPDFVGDLLSAVLDEVAAEGRNYGGTATYPLFMAVRTPYSGGSDHYILSDPTVGVPCPMLIQFPDRFYHTSADTLDKVDPQMLARVGTMAAAYLYFLASAGPREAAWLAGRMTTAFTRDVLRLTEEEIGRLPDAPRPGFGRRLAFLADRKKESLRALARTFGGKEAVGWLERAEKDIEAVVARAEEWTGRVTADLEAAPAGLELSAVAPDASMAAPQTSAAPGLAGGTAAAPPPPPTSPNAASRWAELAGLVPRRLYRGPVSLRPALAALPPERQTYWRSFQRRSPAGLRVASQLVYWMDGRRTLAEVADYLELETGFRDEVFIAGYVDLLVECRLIEFAS